MEGSCQSIGAGVLYPPILMRKKHIVQPSRNTEEVDDCDLKATDGKAPKTQHCADVGFRAQFTIDLRQTATRVQLAPPSRRAWLVTRRTCCSLRLRQILPRSRRAWRTKHLNRQYRKAGARARCEDSGPFLIGLGGWAQWARPLSGRPYGRMWVVCRVRSRPGFGLERLCAAMFHGRPRGRFPQTADNATKELFVTGSEAGTSN